MEKTIDDVLIQYDLGMEDVDFISEHCDGADKLGERYAKLHNAKCSIFPADWRTYGKAAEPIRNSQMIEYASEAALPIVIAFVSPRTKGTRDTIQKARRNGFETIINEYDGDNILTGGK